MRVVYKRPEEIPIILDVHNELETFQRLVGGYIEVVTLRAGIAMIVNEDGKLLGLDPNFKLNGDTIVGPAVFVGASFDDFTDLTEDQAEMVALHFREV